MQHPMQVMHLLPCHRSLIGLNGVRASLIVVLHPLDPEHGLAVRNIARALLKKLRRVLCQHARLINMNAFQMTKE